MKTSIVATLICVSVALILVNFHPVESCSVPIGWKPPTIVELMMWAPRLILATVRRHVPGIYMYGTTYTAEVDVHCILRGHGDVPLRLNVTRAGYVPGMCYAAELEEGQTYIIGLHDDDNSAYPPAIREKDFYEAFQACDLNPPTYPIGFPGDTEITDFVECPYGLPPDACRYH